MQKQLDFNGQKPAETKKKAEVMPQGVLFRGGEEKACRQRFIKDGILEAVIGLPAGLFYGTGIPACVLVLNRDGASGRKSALFLSADREYREGKNQNSLRAEDIEKITHVYHTRLAVDKYSREVPYAELEREDSNLNIRRYVDNSPPPEPHDVRTHLHGGIPVSEIDQLAGYFDNYAGVRELLFQCSHHVPRDDIQDARRGEAKREHRVPRKACHHAEHDDASEDDVGEEADTERCVLPKSLVKALKDERKTLSGEIKEMKKRVKDMRLDTGRMAGIKAPRREINELRADASDIEGEALAKSQRVDAIVITAERDDYIGVMTTNIGASMMGRTGTNPGF